MHRADRALYHCKHNGRNCCSLLPDGHTEDGECGDTHPGEHFNVIAAAPLLESSYAEAEQLAA